MEVSEIKRYIFTGVVRNADALINTYFVPLILVEECYISVEL